MMSSKSSLVTTTDKFFKEGINDIGTDPNLVKGDITPHIEKNNIDTVKKPRNHKNPQEK